MMGIIIGIHILVCFLLIAIVLVQAGRGGGLVEGFSGVESVFGSKTNSFLTRTTTILAVMFFLSCISLAFFSIRQGRSLMKGFSPGQAKTAEPAKAQLPQSAPPVAVEKNIPEPAAPPAAPVSETAQLPQTTQSESLATQAK
jgi:preprotein translocase subunit SecG